MIKVKYEFEDVDYKIIKAEKEFENEDNYLIWKRGMTRGSLFQGRTFKILKVEAE